MFLLHNNNKIREIPSKSIFYKNKSSKTLKAMLVYKIYAL